MLIEAIDRYLQQRPNKYRPIRCFHPSSLHRNEDYLVKHYLDGDGQAIFDSRVLRIFDNGHGVHERLQGYLQDIGILKQAEVPVENDEFEIKGHTDGVIEVNGNGGVLEIKSINVNGFYSTYEPKPEHLLQVNVYMFCTGIPRGVLLYECKDNQELKEFYVKQDSNIINPVLEKIKRVQERIKEFENGQKEPKNKGKR